MKKSTLFSSFGLIASLLAPLGAMAQTYTSSNGYTLTYTTSGTKATITGGTFETTFTGALDIPAQVTNGATTYNVTSIGRLAFRKNTAITSVTLPQGLVSIQQAAFDSTAIAGEVIIPSTVTTIANYAFRGNTTLNKVTFADTPTLTSLGLDVFQSSVITEIVLPNTLKEIPTNAFRNIKTLTTVTFPTAYTSIGNNAFSNTGITGNITFPSTLKTLGSACFGDTPNLQNVTFPDDSPVTAIPDYAFTNSGLQNLSLPKGLVSIGASAYRNCKKMGEFEVVFPTTLKTIGTNAFAYWRPDASNTQVMFTGRNKVVFPAGSALTTIGSDAFRNGKWTGDIDLPAGITRIEDRTFLRNEQWEGHITLPAGLTYIGANAFELVGSTQALVIPASVTTIGNGAFYQSPFSGITFEAGSQLSSLGTAAFRNCFNLSYLDLSNVTKLVATEASREAATTNNSQYAYMPGYTMVYLPANSTVKAGEENFVVGGTCEKFVVYDADAQGRYYSVADKTYDGNRLWVGESKRITPNAPKPENFSMSRGCDYSIQHAFTAKTATYSGRTFAAEKDKVYTLTLPYPATVPAGLKAYTLNKQIEEGFYFLSVDNGKMEASQPYIIRVVDPTQSLVFGADSEVSVPTTPETLTQTVAAEDGLIFHGTTANIFNAEARNKNYYNLSNKIWYPVKTTSEEWTGPSAQDAANGFKGFIRSLRAFIEVPQGVAPAAQFAMMFDDSNDASVTAIEAIKSSVATGKASIYTVDGRYVGNNLETLPSGSIYIVNGKKIFKF